MKKILLSLAAMGMIVTGANAWTIQKADVGGVKTTATGTMVAAYANSQWYLYSISRNNPAYKELYAAALTAKAGGKQITLEIDAGAIVAITVE